jgi:hypothetical protein
VEGSEKRKAANSAADKFEQGVSMNDKVDATKALSRNLQAAIERVRQDVERVEFWAEAVVGFSQPVPDYDRNKGNVWIPSEQATALRSNDKEVTDDSTKPASREKPPNRSR